MLYPILRFLFSLFFRVKIRGNLQVFNQDALIITPNLTSSLDGILLTLFLPFRPVFAISQQQVNHWFYRLAKRYVDFIVIDQNSTIAIRAMINLLANKRKIIIFPEVQITVTGSLMKMYSGAAFLAHKSQTQIVPIWIEGAKLTPFGKLKGVFKRRLFPKISLYIGDAHSFPALNIKSGKRRRELEKEFLRKLLSELCVTGRQDFTLFEVLSHSAQCYGWFSPCIQDEEYGSMSYINFIRHIFMLSRSIYKITHRGENVGCLLPNSLLGASVIFACSVKARVPVMLNYLAGVSGLEHQISLSEVKTVFTSKYFIQEKRLQHFVKQCDRVNWIYLEDFLENQTILDEFTALAWLLVPQFAVEPQLPIDSSVIFFSSGTEGKMKGIVHSHRSLLANTEQIRISSDFSPNDKVMSVLPLFQAFGFMTGLLMPLVAGSKIYLYRHTNHYKKITSLIYKERCSVLFATPDLLSHYARVADPMDFVHLRYVFSGGEALTENVRQIWQDNFGIRILEGYGLTECAPVLCTNLTVANRLHTVGRFLPTIEYRLVVKKGMSQGGVLQVKGPNIMKGYLSTENAGRVIHPCAENANGEKEEHWFETGDIVSIDKDGFVTLLGRFGRFGKIKGDIIPLVLVEKLAKKAAPLHEHHAVVAHDPNKGEYITLFTTAPQLKKDSLRVIAHNLGMGPNTIPSEIKVLSEIPLLLNGECNIELLKQMITEPHMFL